MSPRRGPERITPNTRRPDLQNGPSSADPNLPPDPWLRHNTGLGRYNKMVRDARSGFPPDFQGELSVEELAHYNHYSVETVKQRRANADAAKRAFIRELAPEIQSTVERAGPDAPQAEQLIQTTLAESFVTFQDGDFLAYGRARIQESIARLPTLRQIEMERPEPQADTPKDTEVTKNAKATNDTKETPTDTDIKTIKTPSSTKRARRSAAKTETERTTTTPEPEETDDDSETPELDYGAPLAEISETILDSEDPDLSQLIGRVITNDIVLGTDTNGEHYDLESPVAEERDSSPVVDTLSQYIREITAVPLLNGEQEVELAQAIEKGNLAADRLAENPDNEDALEAEIRAGKAANRTLIESNLRLVANIARRYSGKGLPTADLIQEGNFGLLRAAEKFDHSRGYRFSTYAYWWIRQAVTRALSNSSRIKRVPVHALEAARGVERTRAALAQVFGRNATDEEVGFALGESGQWVTELMTNVQQPSSTETPLGQEGQATLGDFLEDKDNPPPIEEAEKNDDKHNLQAILDDVFANQPGEGSRRGRERRVLELRFGLHGTPLTLKEIAFEFGVTRERVRQIEANALNRLRRVSTLRLLKSYFRQTL